MTEDDEDDRKPCTECQHYRAERCHQAKRAGLSPWASIEIGTTLANLPQRCPAYKGKQ